jgi:threonine synthase
MWRYNEHLPVDAANIVTLGEGMTPLLRAEELGRQLDVGSLFIKDESRNPTWSFKDRLASVAVSAARQLGAKVIATSSSGNAGAAAAAYAARAGLPCVVVTFHGAAGPLMAQMRAYGAMVLSVPTKADRWTLLEAGIRRFRWFPTSPFFGPVVGSNPLGVEGYKTIAYEIAEQMNWMLPDWFALPVCYGDALYGITKGFLEMKAWGWTKSVPRVVAAEIYGSLSLALTSGADAVPDMPNTHETVAISISATQSTYQAIDALRRARGVAITVPEPDLVSWQRDLARHEGIYAEASSVAPFSAIAQLRARGIIARGESVVALVTASGLKDADVTTRGLAPPPSVIPELGSALDALRSHYGFDAMVSGGEALGPPARP